MNNDIKKIALKILIFAFIFFSVDFVTGYGLKKLFFSQIAGPDYRTNYVINECEADVIIFGSSRANHHYIPDIMTESLHMSVYNAGRDAQSILYHYAVLKSMIERHVPKKIILDFNLRGFWKRNQDYAKLIYLLPYYNDFDAVKEVINFRSRFEYLKFFSHSYPYNSTPLSAIAFSMNINHPLIKSKTNDINGYLPLYGQIAVQSIQEQAIVPVIVELDEIKVNYFKKFVTTCVENNIELILCISPTYNLTVIDTATKNILNQTGAKLYSLNNIKGINGIPEYFRDSSHLNNEGAKVFTKYFVSKIKKGLINIRPFQLPI